MDKIDKALRRLTSREREGVRRILESITQKQFKGLDLKKLKGRNDIFRVRKGSVRIIYRQTNTDIIILAIERRTTKTYKRF